MIHDLKPYPAYKDSGVPWLGEVPEHWKLQRTKTVLRERIQKGFPDEPLLAATQTKGVVRKELYENRTVLAQKDLHLLKLVRVNDFVISLRSFQGGIEYAHEQGIISPAYTILYPMEAQNHGFLAWLFKSKPYIENLSLFVTGIREGQNIDYVELSRSELPLPPLSEQSAIVRYLDYIDRRIRHYIRSKQKLIKLLEEQKQAIIHQAVTRGLDPHVHLKPSGIEWLEEIPEHWEEVKLKFLSRKITDGEHISPPIVDEGIPLLSAKDVRDWKIGYAVDKFVLPKLAKKFWQRCCPLKGDLLVVSRGATIGRVAIVEDEKPFCLMGSVILCQCREEYSNEFLYYALNAKHAQTSLWFSSASSAQQAIYIEDVAELRLPIPPIYERKLIVEYLMNLLSHIDSIIEKTQKEISLLREYRIRLIADVVTGKLDVREAVANLPEETDETESFDDSLPEDDDLENSEIENDQAGELEEEILA